jgi:hypothetical protein
MFFYLAYPPGGDRDFLALQQPPARWFENRVFNAHDWYKEVQYLKVTKDALVSGTIPFHVPDLGRVFTIKNRFLGAVMWTMSPQIILLYLLDPFTFAVINLLIMYSVGFYGCMLIRKHYQLGLIPFAFIFILFNFNGHFVEKVTAYGPGQMGYFLLPFFILLIMRAAQPKLLDKRQQVRIGLLLGLVVSGIYYQGSMHFFIDSITFLFIWGIVNYKFWRLTASTFAAAFSTAAVRLLPTAVTFGAAANRHDWPGYTPTMLFRAVLLTNTQLSPPHFAWWEYSLYIGWVGVFALLFFGLWGSFRKYEWVKFKGWQSLALPCFIMFFLSLLRFKNLLIPRFISLLNGESKPSLYMIFPLLFLVVIAAVNMEEYLNIYRKSIFIKSGLTALLVAMALSIFNHSRIWRLHRVQSEFDWVTANRIWGELPSPNIVLSIKNNMADTLYVYSFWVGLFISVAAFILVIWWLIKIIKNKEENNAIWIK